MIDYLKKALAYIPDATQNAKKLKAVLMDIAPDQKANINLFSITVTAEIPKEIVAHQNSQNSKIQKHQKERWVKRLTNEWAIDRQKALWAVECWCEVLDSNQFQLQNNFQSPMLLFSQKESSQGLDALITWATKEKIPSKRLPRHIEELTKLKELDLSELGLTQLPESIGKLTKLTKLNISGNKLICLPESICELTNLTKLYCVRNRIETLPENIGNLIALTEFYIYNNQLKRLPDAFCNLTNLCEFLVWENRLVSLPENIGNLRSLTKFYIWNNPLSSLPKSIKKLRYEIQDELKAVVKTNV